MRTEMTKNVGYERYWDSGAAVTPGVAAQSLYDFEKTITAEKNGQFWAPRGSKDIGSWINVMGKNQNKDDTSPLQLPW